MNRIIINDDSIHRPDNQNITRILEYCPKLLKKEVPPSVSRIGKE